MTKKWRANCEPRPESKIFSTSSQALHHKSHASPKTLPPNIVNLLLQRTEPWHSSRAHTTRADHQRTTPAREK